MEKFSKESISGIGEAIKKQAGHIKEQFFETKPEQFVERRVRSFAVYAPHTAPRSYEYDLEKLKEDEVEIKVDFCGLCHTDIAIAQNDFPMKYAMGVYPAVPGHEVVGTVMKMGPLAEKSGLQIGQRVGVGWFKRSCGDCEFCAKGKDNYCLSKDLLKPTCAEGNFGGFSEYLHVQSTWVFPIPENISSEQAAPILCAGVTCFEPIEKWCKAGDSVGVIGLGGLGHMAVQIAAAKGCSVTVYSTSEDKETDALRLGAKKFVDVSKVSDWNALFETENFLLSTVYEQMNWEKIISLLKPEGVLCQVGWVSKEMRLPVVPLLYRGRVVAGSNVASSAVTQRCLDFCSKHNIRPIVETFSSSQLADQVSRFIKDPKSMNYRCVIRMDSF